MRSGPDAGPPSPGTPRNLHLSHGWGGGLDGWVRDFCRADTRSENLVLEPVTVGGVIGMEYRLREGRSGAELDAWTLQRPIATTVVEHAEYRERLAGIVERYRIGHLYHSSFLGHSLDSLGLGVPVTKIYHDFYPWCPAIHCHFGGPCVRCDDARLRDCVAGNEMMTFNRSAEGWLEVRRGFLERAAGPHVRHVFPSPAAERLMRSLEPAFERIPAAVIEHGIGHGPGDAFGGAEEGRRLRVGIVGRLQVSKGLRVVERIFDLARSIADLHFLGSGPVPAGLDGRWGTVRVPRYLAAELPALLAEHRLDLALFLSVVPETFSYALSEVASQAVPPAARRLGSFEDRIRDGENGFLLGPADEDVVAFLLRVDARRELLRDVAARLRSAGTRSLEAMVADYYRLRGAG